MYPLGFVSSCASGSSLCLSLFTNKLVYIACLSHRNVAKPSVCKAVCPSFFSINTLMQFYGVAFSNASQRREKEGEKKEGRGECLWNASNWEAAFQRAGGMVPRGRHACLPRVALLLQGLVLADYSSVASHFRFI
uniref:Uncharacterized protein n=1 Tax=Falco tinnunculus TaxID=100819 RepID=A0A8C4UI16_FALTI